MQTTLRFQFLCLVVATMALVAAASTEIAAQDATPPVEPIVASILGRGLPSDSPGKVLQLERITFAPEAEIPHHTHPGAYVIYVDSGDFGFTVVKGEAEIARAGATAPEPIQAGTEVVAHEGDTLFENAGVVHTARNAGTTPLVILTAALLAADEPDIQLTNAEGTPIPQ